MPAPSVMPALPVTPAALVIPAEAGIQSDRQGARWTSGAA